MWFWIMTLTFLVVMVIRDYSNSWDVPKLQHLDAKIQWMWRQPSERDSKFTPSHSDLTSKNRVLEHGPRFFVCYEDGLERCCAQNNPAVSALRAKIHKRWRHLKKSVDQPEFGTQYVFCHSTESGFAAIKRRKIKGSKRRKRWISFELMYCPKNACTLRKQWRSHFSKIKPYDCLLVPERDIVFVFCPPASIFRWFS